MRIDSENETDRLAELKAVRQVTLGGMAVNVALSALKAASGWLAGRRRCWRTRCIPRPTS